MENIKCDLCGVEIVKCGLHAHKNSWSCNLRQSQNELRETNHEIVNNFSQKSCGILAKYKVSYKTFLTGLQAGYKGKKTKGIYQVGVIRWVSLAYRIFKREDFEKIVELGSNLTTEGTRVLELVLEDWYGGELIFKNGNVRYNNFIELVSFVWNYARENKDEETLDKLIFLREAQLELEKRGK